MFPLTPRATLLLLLALAVAVAAGGLCLARRQESVRLDRDRAPLRRFSGEVQAELQRLEELYESHLTRLTRLANGTDAFEIKRAADRLVGIRQVSLLHHGGKETDLHVLASAPARERTPIPTFDQARQRSAGTPLLLSPERIFAAEVGATGWLAEAGKPLIFWQRTGAHEAAVLLIDEAAVEEAIGGWLKKWAAAQFALVRAGGGPDQLLARGGRALLFESAAPAVRPDLWLPLRSRFGTWDVVSWDRRETRTHYDPATLAISGALALGVACLALLVFGQQRSAAALAAQRVSFVNRVSHELRTPLTNILLNLDLATDALLDPPSDATRRLSLVHEETRRLGRLIDNVLTFSKQEQGKLSADASACVPAGVIAAVIEQFAPSFQRRALEIRCTGQCAEACLLDADALAQILGNLLSNVEKYVPGGVVEIAGALADGVLSITVADEGPGIPAQAAERIFRPFERLENRVNEGASGTGLGLAIARELAVAMGGTLQLVPSARGAAFELRIPAPPAAPLTAVSAA